MFRFEFPKRSPYHHQAFQFPAKRRKTVLLEMNDDSSWEQDIFCLFDIESFETSELGSPDAFQQPTLFSFALDSDEICFVAVQKPQTRRTSALAVQQDQGRNSRVMPPAMVSPALNHSPSMAHLIVPAACITSKFKHSKEPTLLTLATFPFRIMYCNEAFTKLSASKTSVIGDSVFDAFDLEGGTLRPNAETFPTLIGRLDNQVALLPSFTDDQSNQYWIRCAVQAYGVNKHNCPNELEYLAVGFTPIQEPSVY